MKSGLVLSYPHLFFTGLLALVLFLYGNKAQSQITFNKTVNNISTGADGTTASQGQILAYIIEVKNLVVNNITNAMLYDYIPAGTIYVAGSTTLNGVAVADAGGNMPFSSGGLINSQYFSPGVLGQNREAVIEFRVRVTANGGTITNYASLEGKYNGAPISQHSNTVFTNLSPDVSCSVIYQSVANRSYNLTTFRYIRSLDPSDGTAGPILFNGATGPCYNAITGAALSTGTVLTNSAAIAYDKASNRIYFVNNSASFAEDLCYIDLNTVPVSAKRFIGYPLVTTVGEGMNVNRMTFSSDGYGYAITSNAQEIIRFSIDAGTGLPVISPLGALINDASNGSNDILAEGGGDIFSDGSGKLYLVANSSKLYKINPGTRIATFLGSVNPFPGTSNSIAIDASGTVYIGGSYQNVFTVNLGNMAASSITGGSTTDVYTNADYTSCALPVLAPALSARKTYRNINGKPFVVAGDTIEYIITVTNTGNINAAGVKLYDSIPGSMYYLPGSTTMNGVAVADEGTTMPYYVPGGRFVHSPGEQDGILKPGTANQAIVTFRAVTSILQRICNQSRVTLTDANGNSIFVNSDDTTQQGSQNSTCFFSDGPLPINDLKWKGTYLNGRDHFQWSMADEALIHSYEVEYSGNGNHFTTIGRQLAQKNYQGVARYSFIYERESLLPVRYYRLKVLSASGNYMYSAIIRINTESDKITVQPNPFTDKINIRLHLNKMETLQVGLKNLNGISVLAVSRTLPAGTHTIKLEAPVTLPRGIYFLEVIVGGIPVHHVKLIKGK